MTWITQERKLGMCTIYRGFIKQSDLVRELETDMYSKYLSPSPLSLSVFVCVCMCVWVCLYVCVCVLQKYVL
jgi:hypothetical protein